MHQKVEDGKNAQAFKLFVVHKKEARAPLLISLFFTKILWKITEIQLSFVETLSAPGSLFSREGGSIYLVL